jgi:CheY-like chemotaxis protein
VVEDNEKEIADMVEALQYSDVDVTRAKTGKEAISLVREKNFDCIVLDLLLPDAAGIDIIEELERKKTEKKTALIVYSAKDLNQKEKAKLDRFANTIILKSAYSLNSLVDQVALYMHRAHKDLPEKMRNIIEGFYLNNEILKGKKVLIVDDDMRNLFALTTALERFELKILNAESGQEALYNIKEHRDIDIVLMDIMMPEMDGYETMRQIRKENKNKDLTIIAVTAKAMKGDRQKSIESGANDYITKPVNVDELVSLMRVWLKAE